MRIALIWGSKENRRQVREQLSRFKDGFEVVFQANSPIKHLKELKRSRPDVIMVTTGYPNTFDYEVNPRFSKIRKHIPDAKILVRTELSREHEFVQQAIRANVSVIDERLDFDIIAAALKKVAEGNQVIEYAPRNHDLETHHRPPTRERF